MRDQPTEAGGSKFPAVGLGGAKDSMDEQNLTGPHLPP
jgi:hypothetical protein